VKTKAANDTYLQQMASTVCGSTCCIAVWTTAPTQGYVHAPCSNTPLYFSNDATVAGCNVIACTSATPLWISFSCSLTTVSFTDVQSAEACDDTPFCGKTGNPPTATGLNIGPTGCATILPCDCNSGAYVDCKYTVANFATQSRFNTGVDGTGVPLPDFSLAEIHYTLTAVPSGTTQIMVRTSAGGYPFPYWNGDDAFSAWIGPNNDNELDGTFGDFTYRTTIDLSVAPVAPITFKAACDNICSDVLINGNSIGAHLTPNPMPSGEFSTFYTFTIPVSCLHFFQAGANTVDFVVCNQGGPTGLRVEFQ